MCWGLCFKKCTLCVIYMCMYIQTLCFVLTLITLVLCCSHFSTMHLLCFVHMYFSWYCVALYTFVDFSLLQCCLVFQHSLVSFLLGCSFVANYSQLLLQPLVCVHLLHFFAFFFAFALPSVFTCQFFTWTKLSCHSIFSVTFILHFVLGSFHLDSLLPRKY